MTLAVDAVIIAGGLFFGRWIARSLRRRAGRRAAAGSGRSESTTEIEDRPAAFPLKLGDVVVRRFEGDEAWLAGALVLAEERPVATLFIAPDAQGERAVLVGARAGGALIWLKPLVSGAVGRFKDAPLALEHAGLHFRRTRRLPVRVERLGTGAPDVEGSAIFGEYAAPGIERLVLLVAAETVLAWLGVSLAEEQYDILPGSTENAS